LPSAPASRIFMLSESSTSTAIMFCCDFSSATVIAGSHSSVSSSATIAASNPPSSHARQLASSRAALGLTPISRSLLPVPCSLPPRIRGTASGIRRHTSHPNPPIATAVSRASSQPGHAPSRINLPLVNTGIGYLNKNSNMRKRFEVSGSRFEGRSESPRFQVGERYNLLGDCRTLLSKPSPQA
jgi:hypothetical protein